ncbi:MAG: GNAT family N-acetyltransferase [Burkholderiaceae bacterium]|nr:GNAT family N-acetyltransferase [Burkholderiaceae bacterium]
MPELDYVIRELTSPLQVDATDWDALLALQSHPSPFMRHAYLAAMHSSGCASPETGWTPRFITLWQGKALCGACALYLKDHSYGEFVFDHAWANAYQQHGLAYYPKALIAPPFTPVPGSRLLARDAESRQLLLKAVIAWCEQENLSSLHLLFCSDDDVETCKNDNLMLRHTVQFHWTNKSGNYTDFDDFLAGMTMEKRKKIRQERRKVAEAGVTFRWSLGADISAADWDVFYRCYERTYWEHGNAPYLSRDFFAQMQHTMPENWLLFVAERAGEPIATSLVAVQSINMSATVEFKSKNDPENEPISEKIAYGRYWGALERVDCLHFEACYYQPIQWCIEHGYQRFEGGAQGEHKMARALLPIKATSAHWLAHPAFAEAVQRFLDREGQGIENYMDDLAQRNPLKLR